MNWNMIVNQFLSWTYYCLIDHYCLPQSRGCSGFHLSMCIAVSYPMVNVEFIWSAMNFNFVFPSNSFKRASWNCESTVSWKHGKQGDAFHIHHSSTSCWLNTFITYILHTVVLILLLQTANINCYPLFIKQKETFMMSPTKLNYDTMYNFTKSKMI